MNLGENLRQARLDKNMTQEVVAKTLYVTRQTVSRWEQNTTCPNVYVLKELSRLYDVSIDQFYSIANEQDVIDEGEKPMKKINIFALFGSVFFNAFLFSGVAITGVVLILSYWITIGAFIASPFILFVVNVTGMQAFDWINTILALIFCPLGLVNIRFAKRLPQSTYDMFLKYWKFNMRSIGLTQ